MIARHAYKIGAPDGTLAGVFVTDTPLLGSALALALGSAGWSFDHQTMIVFPADRVPVVELVTGPTGHVDLRWQMFGEDPSLNDRIVPDVATVEAPKKKTRGGNTGESYAKDRGKGTIPQARSRRSS